MPARPGVAVVVALVVLVALAVGADLMIEAGAISFLTRTGPLAWDGVLVF